MQEFLTRLLAQFFEAFKLKNPTLAAVVQIALGAILYTTQQGETLGLFTLPEWAAAITSAISGFLMAVVSPQTFRFLPEAQQAKARPGASVQ